MTGSWIGSVLNLGALASALVGGYLVNRFGPKWTMISMVVPFSIGYLLILLPYPLNMDDVPSEVLFIVGRFFIGTLTVTSCCLLNTVTLRQVCRFFVIYE